MFLLPHPLLAQSWLQLPHGRPGVGEKSKLRGDRTRSLSISDLAPLRQVRGASFASPRQGTLLDRRIDRRRPCNWSTLAGFARFCRRGRRPVAGGSGDHDRRKRDIWPGRMEAGVGDVAIRRGLVMVAGTRGPPVVSDDAIVSSFRQGDWDGGIKWVAGALSLFVEGPSSAATARSTRPAWY